MRPKQFVKILKFLTLRLLFVWQRKQGRGSPSQEIVPYMKRIPEFCCLLMMMCCFLRHTSARYWSVWMSIRQLSVPADEFLSLLMTRKTGGVRAGFHPNSCQCSVCTLWGMEKNCIPPGIFQEAEIC